MGWKRKPAKPEMAVAKRQRLANGSSLGDYLRYHGYAVQRRIFRNGQVLYVIALEVFQHLIRDLINRVSSRWGEDLPLGWLDIESVFIEDNTLFIPMLGTGEEDKDYPGKTRNVVVGVFGQSGSWEELDDFLLKLSITGLPREQFDALYFHPLLNNREQRIVFPEFVDKFRHKKVSYDGRMVSWEKAFDKWEKLKYPLEQQINLEAACQKVDEYALKVYKFKTYKKSRASKIKLARNIMVHLNDYRIRDSKRLYTEYELGLLVEAILPGLGLRLFTFMWELGLDPDFKRRRNRFRCLSRQPSCNVLKDRV